MLTLTNTKTLLHIGIACADFETSKTFWEEVFGTTAYNEYEISGAFLEKLASVPHGVTMRRCQIDISQDAFIELIQFSHEPNSAPRALSENGTMHLCVRLGGDDFHAELSRIISLGGRLVGDGPVLIESGANAGAWAVNILSPEGAVLELFKPAVSA